MKQSNSIHLPFKQLPLESKGLLFIIAMAEMADYRSWPPTLAEIGGDLEQLWDREKLTEPISGISAVCPRW